MRYPRTLPQAFIQHPVSGLYPVTSIMLLSIIQNPVPSIKLLKETLRHNNNIISLDLHILDLAPGRGNRIHLNGDDLLHTVFNPDDTGLIAGSYACEPPGSTDGSN